VPPYVRTRATPDAAFLLTFHASDARRGDVRVYPFV
jgi:hypothetical protein